MMTMRWWDIAPLGWENILVCLVWHLVGLGGSFAAKPGGDHLFLIVLGTYCFLAIGAAVSPSGRRSGGAGQLITGVGFHRGRDDPGWSGAGVTSAAAIWMLAALGAHPAWTCCIRRCCSPSSPSPSWWGGLLEASFKSLRRRCTTGWNTGATGP